MWFGEIKQAELFSLSTEIVKCAWARNSRCLWCFVVRVLLCKRCQFLAHAHIINTNSFQGQTTHSSKHNVRFHVNIAAVVHIYLSKTGRQSAKFVCIVPDNPLLITCSSPASSDANQKLPHYSNCWSMRRLHYLQVNKVATLPPNQQWGYTIPKPTMRLHHSQANNEATPFPSQQWGYTAPKSTMRLHYTQINNEATLHPNQQWGYTTSKSPMRWHYLQVINEATLPPSQWWCYTTPGQPWGCNTFKSTTRLQELTKRSCRRLMTCGLSSDVSRRVRADPQQLWSSRAPQRMTVCSGFFSSLDSWTARVRLW